MTNTPPTLSFYHLTTTPLERALPKLLEKAYGAGMRALVLASGRERVEALSEALWTYDQDSFLPHGTAAEPYAAQQPILISESWENTNGAAMALVTDGRLVDAPEAFARCIDMFDGTCEEQLTAARTRWKHYLAQGLKPLYFRQNDKGGWEQQGG